MPNIDLTNLTDEQKKLVEEFLYSKSKYSTPSDETGFVIPFIAMNDGHTPAQIRTQPKGLYKDIQRSPFLRKTGTFSDTNSIPDIDISPLVYYGTLEQSKIAPTLENIDIKLYYREPTLKKVPDNANNTDPESYADNYIWRELPVGFHVYNNDTVYGYEWVVLQDDYVNTDGVYNLHMNIEDGLGCCKFAGTQAPINLSGIQYKIIITAKNLWNREYSLIDTTPVLHSLEGSSDELAPSVDAIKKYYAAALETLKVVTETLLVGDSEDPIVNITKDNVTIKQIHLGEIENLEKYLNEFADDYNTHKTTYIDNATFDDNGNVIGIHGIVNKGFAGNIAAKTLDGLTISNGQQSLSADVNGNYAYIPYVDSNSEIGFGTIINYYTRSGNSDPTPVYRTSYNKQNTTLIITNTSRQTDVTDLLESISVGSTVLNSRISTINDVVTLTLTSGSSENGNVNLKTNKLTVASIGFENSELIINPTRVAYWNGASSIAYKNPISEDLGIKLKEANDGTYKTLTPNTNKDADGNLVEALDTTSLDNTLKVASKEDAEAFDKLGSALQALHELPLGTYTYKRGQDEYKEQLGIFVERVNQIRDHLIDLIGDGENGSVPADNNYLVYKKNSLVKSSNEKVVNANDGIGDVESTIYRKRIEDNAYTYTAEEIKSIAHYLDLTTSKKELAQEIKNTVGILLKAAKETQDRLLDVETAVYGFDAKTLPGSDDAKKAFVDEHIDEKLQEQLNSSPLLLGLNRLMRALLLEIFDTTDLEDIDAEIESRLADSDNLGDKVTIKSRMDKIDEIVQESYNQASAAAKYYIENVLVDEGHHTYTDILSFNGTQRITDTYSTTEDETLLDNLYDDHSETKDVDKGRSWRTLPAKRDVTDEAKNNIGFAEISPAANRHTPNADESGIVRIPDIKEVQHEDTDSEGNKTIRSWNLFKLDKSADSNTYLPLFKTKAVAWDSAKIERINTKLSEVTKTIYGVDDVTTSLPNRTEVLRRNITNLVDDLYPNRSFKIERDYTDVTVPTANLKLPFKTSKKQNPDENTVATENTDEKLNIEHTSIITYFDDALFNFDIQNSYFGEKSELKENDTIKYKSNKQISLDNTTGLIDFTTENLVTDIESFDPANYGTYNKAYSKLDLISGIIGLKDCYISDLFSTNILDAFEIGNKYQVTVNIDPKARNWYEKLATNSYILTSDTTPVDGKFYYAKLAGSDENLDSSYIEIDTTKYRDSSYYLDLAASGNGATEEEITNTRAAITKQESYIQTLNENKTSEEEIKDVLEKYKTSLETQKVTTQNDLKVAQAAMISKTDIESKQREVTAASNTLKDFYELATTGTVYKILQDINTLKYWDCNSDIDCKLFTIESYRNTISSKSRYRITNVNSDLSSTGTFSNFENWEDARGRTYSLLASYLNEKQLTVTKKLTDKLSTENAEELSIKNTETYLSKVTNNIYKYLQYYQNVYEEKLKALNAANNSNAQNESKEKEKTADLSHITEDIQNTENSIAVHAKSISDLTERIAAADTVLNSYKTELNTLLISADLYSDSAQTYAVLKDYKKELEFENFVGPEYTSITNSVSHDDDLVNSILTASNLGFVLSRKVKTLQARITTIEAFADELARGFNYINVLKEDSSNTKKLFANRRYEAVDVYNTLKYIGTQLHVQNHLIPVMFDIDLTESYTNTFDHNVTLWQVIALSTNVKKTALTLSTTGDFLSSYQITGTLTTDPENLSSATTALKTTLAANYKESQDWTITVKYIKANTTLTDLDAHTIYLIGKTPTTNYAAFYNNKTTTYLNGGAGYQNQTEYNIYKTINNLFSSLLNNGTKGNLAANTDTNNLYYQLMLLAHPVGSIYTAMNVTDINLITPDKLFGGTWQELKDGYLLPSATADNATSLANAAKALTTTTATAGTVATTSQTSLTVENIPNIKIKAWVRTA